VTEPHSLKCPFCGEEIPPAYMDRAQTIPSGVWVCESCAVDAGAAMACRPALRLVEPNDLRYPHRMSSEPAID
jgi:ribosomal protein L37AE/L43A